jgi:hypothetical protein
MSDIRHPDADRLNSRFDLLGLQVRNQSSRFCRKCLEHRHPTYDDKVSKMNHYLQPYIDTSKVLCLWRRPPTIQPSQLK